MTLDFCKFKRTVANKRSLSYLKLSIESSGAKNLADLNKSKTQTADSISTATVSLPKASLSTGKSPAIPPSETKQVRA